MESFGSYFLTAERSSEVELKSEKIIIESIGYVEEIINALANVALIVNKNRQTLFSNRILLKALGLTEDTMLIGLRPGEILRCLHSTELSGGCGTTESCRYCGAANALKECFETKKIIEKDCRILATEGGKISAIDYRVTASPVTVGGLLFCILTLCDVSDEKRRKILEKVFIHDIINITGGLQGMINYLLSINKSDDDTPLEIMKRGVTDLVEEIISQRELLAAENNEIKVKSEKINSFDFIKEIIGIMENHSVANNKVISLTTNFKYIDFFSDAVLLKRVFINMIKNALEACTFGSTITIDLEEKNGELVFSVNNPGTISKEIQLQIFQRSFSTKDVRRGLGTYSIKLFAENYLQGKVFFKSDFKSGTTFYISIPQSNK